MRWPCFFNSIAKCNFNITLGPGMLCMGVAWIAFSTVKSGFFLVFGSLCSGVMAQSPSENTSFSFVQAQVLTWCSYSVRTSSFFLFKTTGGFFILSSAPWSARLELEVVMMKNLYDLVSGLLKLWSWDWIILRLSKVEVGGEMVWCWRWAKDSSFYILHGRKAWQIKSAMVWSWDQRSAIMK